MEEKLINYLKTEIIPSGEKLELLADEDLLSSGLLGSMDVFRLIEFIEGQFNIKVGPAEMTIENFISVDAMTTYIQQKQTA